MKLDSLRKVIREEVKTAIREELQDMLTEAVKIASAPSTEKNDGYKPVVEKDLKRTWSKGPLNPAVGGIESMLEQTAASMTQADYRNVINADSSAVSAPNMASSMASSMGMTGPAPGLDLSKLDFLGKAKSILDAANKKDVERRPV